MASRVWRTWMIGTILAIWGNSATLKVQAQNQSWEGLPMSTPSPAPQQPELGLTRLGPIHSVDQLFQLGPAELDALYQQCPIAPLPSGKVRGRALLFPGTRLARPASKAARAFWQGKVFDSAKPGAVNRFFGLRMIRADVYQDQSWMDGQPCLVLDYSQTSRVYARYRDEIRQVAPGLLLGVMYDRKSKGPQPEITLYFALECQP